MSINDDLIKEVLDEMTPEGGTITQDAIRRVIAEALVKFVQKQDLADSGFDLGWNWRNDE